MKFRPQRGGLAEAMSEVQEIAPTLEALKIAMQTVYGTLAPAGKITVEAYGYDDRIGWDTYLVCEDGRACGYTDGPLSKNDPYLYEQFKESFREHCDRPDPEPTEYDWLKGFGRLWRDAIDAARAQSGRSLDAS